MKDYQKRVVSERVELSDKVTKLKFFLDSKSFNQIDIDEQNRLIHQFKIMNEYLDILNQRIINFK